MQRATWVSGHVIRGGGAGGRASTMGIGEEEPGPTTMAVGEEDLRMPTTMATGEEGGGPTTMATGEEEVRSAATFGGGPITTLAIGEEAAPTTLRLGEEGFTTLAVGEEARRHCSLRRSTLVKRPQTHCDLRQRRSPLVKKIRLRRLSAKKDRRRSPSGKRIHDRGDR